jgi:hypothetical protein
MAAHARDLYQNEYARSRFFEHLEGILQDMTQGAKDTK